MSEWLLGHISAWRACVRPANIRLSVININYQVDNSVGGGFIATLNVKLTWNITPDPRFPPSANPTPSPDYTSWKMPWSSTQRLESQPLMPPSPSPPNSPTQSIISLVGSTPRHHLNPHSSRSPPPFDGQLASQSPHPSPQESPWLPVQRVPFQSCLRIELENCLQRSHK